MIGVLAVDPDSKTPGLAALVDGAVFVWGGNKSSEHLATARGVASFLDAHSVSQVYIEGALPRGVHQSSCEGVFRCRFAWEHVCDLRGIPSTIYRPGFWINRWVGKGPESKKRYKAKARKLLKCAVNEDAAAALGILGVALAEQGIDICEMKLTYGRPNKG